MKGANASSVHYQLAGHWCRTGKIKSENWFDFLVSTHAHVRTSRLKNLEWMRISKHGYPRPTEASQTEKLETRVRVEGRDRPANWGVPKRQDIYLFTCALID